MYGTGREERLLKRASETSKFFGCYLILRNPAIAHLKGPTDFMPYCGNALLPYNYILELKKNVCV